MTTGNKRRSLPEKLLAAFLAAVLLLSLGTADAAAHETEMSVRPCSLTVYLKNSAQVPVFGAELTLYMVADAELTDFGPVFSLTGDFADSGISISDLNADDLALSLAAYASENSLTGITKRTAADGSAVFGELDAGLYLAVLSGRAGRYGMLPFLVPLPMYDASCGEWEYDVSACPKIGGIDTVPPDGGDDGPVTDGGKEPSEKPSLIQTGQLNMPVPVLAFSGTAAIALGWALINSKKRNGDA